jgi:ketosteroid isomerase-like protein
VSKLEEKPTTVTAPRRILKSVLTALSQGNISEVVEQFDDHFTFTDHALALEFVDKQRLAEFLHKSRELFPDTAMEVVSIFECGDYVIAEWKLTATQTVPYRSVRYRFPILLRGSTIVHIENGRVTRWSDFYDQNTSRRVNLAAFFTEWIEY